MIRGRIILQIEEYYITLYYITLLLFISIKEYYIKSSVIRSPVVLLKETTRCIGNRSLLTVGAPAIRPFHGAKYFPPAPASRRKRGRNISNERKFWSERKEIKKEKKEKGESNFRIRTSRGHRCVSASHAIFHLGRARFTAKGIGGRDWKKKKGKGETREMDEKGEKEKRFPWQGRLGKGYSFPSSPLLVPSEMLRENVRKARSAFREHSPRCGAFALDVNFETVRTREHTGHGTVDTRSKRETEMGGNDIGAREGEGGSREFPYANREEA